MSPSRDRQRLLFRMEESRRQTQRQLDLIDRQIIRRVTALVPPSGRYRSACRRGWSPKPRASLTCYHANLAAITSERQPEIDALSSKLDRQEAAITGLAERSDYDQAGRADVNAR